MTIGFPRQAVTEVLSIAGVDAGDLDRVAVAAFTEAYSPQTRPNKGWFQEASAAVRVRNEISSALARPLGGLRIARQGHRYLKRLSSGPRRSGVRRMLAELGVRAPISYHEHHRCHAIAAFDASGFEEAVSISLDGGGDGCSSHVYSLSQQEEYLINSLESFDSIGNFYAYVTHLCGFRAALHEGKITGLAASGEPRYLDIFRGLIRYEDGQIHNVGRVYHRGAINHLRQQLPSDWEHKDLAASVQKHLEEVVVPYIRCWLERSGKRNLCFSGGVAANVLLNQKIAGLPECDGIFIFPAMGDGGLAVGAAFSEWRRSPGFSGPLSHGSPTEHVYLGRSYSEQDIEQALKNSGLEYLRFQPIEDVIATLIHEGRVVARFNGAMEFGPRALGNRSILYRPTEPSVNKWLNKRLKRTEFMPFAPACLAEKAKGLFHWNAASSHAARFMTITLDCSDWMKENCPAVVHVDGTARPQLVDRQTNPSFHRLLERYCELSGLPVVVNTSFNMHEEPIVRSPRDAIRSYQLGQLDNLAIGPFLLGGPPRTIHVD
jgi:carbamoyltransferase